MAVFQFINRSVTFNSETEICFISNSSFGPLFILTKLYILSPSGCPYTIFRFYKNSVESNPFATPSIAQFTNILNQNVDIQVEPGSNLSITAVNLDPAQQTHSFEGSLGSE